MKNEKNLSKYNGEYFSKANSILNRIESKIDNASEIKELSHHLLRLQKVERILIKAEKNDV